MTSEAHFMRPAAHTRAGAGETARAFSERINMLRVALSTIEELVRGGKRGAEVHKLLSVIEKTARHALDRDLQPIE